MIDRRQFLGQIVFSSALLAGCRSLTPVAPATALKKNHGIYWNSAGLKHDYPGQPEGSLRLESILKILREQTNFETFAEEKNRLASIDELKEVHDLSYVEEIQHWKSERYFRANRWSPYWTENAFEAAASAAAVSIDLVRDIHQGRVKNGFALTRPPGHHANKNTPGGYCIFNNVALAVKNLRRQFGPIRVAILDIDAHHGDGIQEIFYEDPDVLYLSIHQNAWPFTGKMEDTGKGKGKGSTINIPLSPHCGDTVYSQIAETIISPALKRFAPSLIIVANGYDTHWRDSHSYHGLSLTGHAELCRKLNAYAEQFCAGKIAYILEGGYQIEALSHGCLNTFNSLIGERKISDPLGASPKKEPDISGLLKQVKRIHRLGA